VTLFEGLPEEIVISGLRRAIEIEAVAIAEIGIARGRGDRAAARRVDRHGEAGIIRHLMIALVPTGRRVGMFHEIPRAAVCDAQRLEIGRVARSQHLEIASGDVEIARLHLEHHADAVGRAPIECTAHQPALCALLVAALAGVEHIAMRVGIEAGHTQRGILAGRNIERAFQPPAAVARLVIGGDITPEIPPRPCAR
jgi:hypothetical protein